MTRIVLLVALLMAPTPVLAAPITLSLIPSGGSLTGAPGETVGWGYEITNPSGSLWLVIDSLAATPVSPASGLLDTVIFDYPTIAPGAMAVLTWVSGTQGLAEFTFSPSVSPGTSVTGVFTIEGSFYDGHPDSGNFIDFAETGEADFELTAVPEPASLGLLTTGMFALAYRCRHSVNSKNE